MKIPAAFRSGVVPRDDRIPAVTIATGVFAQAINNAQAAYIDEAGKVQRCNLPLPLCHRDHPRDAWQSPSYQKLGSYSKAFLPLLPEGEDRGKGVSLQHEIPRLRGISSH